ncbi:leucine-rich repeat extensin-like protein 5 isoform X2 [Trichoplusia ni]|uniref:Leucine-rich repeat extensin-like protein 5 isoform X2 n=1 Tax=Trichoplusia ni TaxID=7111 RepID=A0A7E5VJK7_TRINI|nr:leucine-rich repeat extensin-like protein 5 isoform X2 [Trichoplusia ni]XP_026728481.1 leucine-rich repeat extensin-like protein 5 isoform X2 [Trichoplusia ni]
MSLTTDLLIFLASFIIINFKGATAENFALDVDEEEESLKQAIFLVELLKSDFGKSLRENNYVISNADNVTEENSTCPTPIGDLENATEPVSTAENSTSISPGAARSDVPAATPSTMPEVRVLTSSPGYIPPGYGLPVYGAPGYGAPGYGLSGYGVPAASTAGNLASASIPPVPGNPPYSNWPAMPNMPMPGYQISPGMPQRRNFPADENYRVQPKKNDA